MGAELDKPDDHLTIVYNGEARELFMSFLRLNSLLRVVEEPARVLLIPVDPDLGENVLRVLLAEKGGAGTMFETELEETAISGGDVEKIQIWAQDHLTYFFMRRFQSMADKAKTLEPIVKALQSSPNGSETSNFEKESVGPLE